MCSVLFLGLIGLTAALNCQFAEEWHSWKDSYGKSYTSELEELERHSVWLSNRKYIEEHNTHADVFGYTLAMNHFGDVVGICACMHRHARLRGRALVIDKLN